jgi:hypothetical protein
MFAGRIQFVIARRGGFLLWVVDEGQASVELALGGLEMPGAQDIVTVEAGPAVAREAQAPARLRTGIQIPAPAVTLPWGA